MFEVYAAKNLMSGKEYIGVTGCGLVRRRRAHLKNARRGRPGRFYDAIRKHGPDAFEWRIIEIAETAEQAFAAEIRLIAERKPRYNMTLGGDRPPETLWTEERRQRQGAAQRRAWTEERKQEHAIAMQASWTTERKQRHAKTLSGRPMHPNTRRILDAMRKAIQTRRRKSVLCLNDGLVFESMSAAAIFYSIRTSAICAAVHGGRREVGGLQFILFTGSPMTETERTRHRILIDQSFADRRKSKRVRPIVPACGGLDKVGRRAIGPLSRAKKVRCVDDGQVFHSVKAAAHHYAVDGSAISELCRGKRGRKTVGGKRFEFIESRAA